MTPLLFALALLLFGAGELARLKLPRAVALPVSLFCWGLAGACIVRLGALL